VDQHSREFVDVSTVGKVDTGEQNLTFSGLPKGSDFGRIGALGTNGETISKVELVGDFDDVKQVNFSDTITAIPEPSTAAMVLLGVAGLGYTAFNRGRRKSTPRLMA
jgi:hypothetical protein